MPRDTIRLDGMVFYGYHGTTTAEREMGQRFVVDLVVEKDLVKAGGSDDLKDTVDYSRLFLVVKQIMEGPSKNLLESLAQSIAQEVLQAFRVDVVGVKITKPQVPIKGSILSGVAVEIWRRRQP